MSILDERIKQQAALEEEIKQAAEDENGEALKEVRCLCWLHGFTNN